MFSSYFNKDIVASGAVIYSTMAEVSSVPLQTSHPLQGESKGSQHWGHVLQPVYGHAGSDAAAVGNKGLTIRLFLAVCHFLVLFPCSGLKDTFEMRDEP